jgi:hypothetical protein
MTLLERALAEVSKMTPEQVASFRAPPREIVPVKK